MNFVLSRKIHYQQVASSKLWKKSKYSCISRFFELIRYTNNNISIYSGTADEILLDSYKMFESIDKRNLNKYIIEDADHFFRDIYLDDVIDLMFD